MKRQKKSEKGITLVALVITIIVLLILAGVSISLVVGDNGILTQASSAVVTNREAKAREEVQLAWASAESAYWTEWAKDTSASKAEIFKTKLGEYLEPTGEVTYLSYVEDGTSLVKYRSNDNGIEYTFSMDSSGNVSAQNEVIIYTDANDATAAIPAGFTVSGFSDESVIANGLVIYEGEVEEEWTEENRATIQSKYNQFVWVPCTGSLSYAKHTYATASVNDASATSDTGNGGWRTYYYRKYSDWTDNGGNSSSVATYGGFYIGRYEAGAPAEFYPTNEDDSTITYTANTATRNVTTYQPVSKRYNPSWNFISQKNAKTVAASMYSGSSSVTSQLVDSYAWDTIVEWMSDAVTSVTDSRAYGNCCNTIITDSTTSALYAIHTINGGWSYASTYENGTVTPKTETATGMNTNRVEIATGALEATKVKNIYDIAGNMYEWTTETGYHDTGSGTKYVVIRGGGFSYGGGSDPVCYRAGDLSEDSTNVDRGFRVVLYVK